MLDTAPRIPCDVDAERAVLASILRHPPSLAVVREKVDPRDFLDDACRVAYGEMVQMHLDGQEPDVALLLRRLREQPEFAIKSAAVFLNEISETVSTGAHAEHFAKAVAEVSRKRQLFEIGNQAANAAMNGQSSDDILADLLADVEHLERGRRIEQLKFSFSELASKHPALPPPVIDGLLRAGETCNIIASTKVGKSWLTYGLALSIITGRPWLDRFETAQGRVLLVDNELHPSTLAHRIAKVAEACNLFPADFQHDLTVWPLRGHLRSLQDLDRDFGEIEHGYYRVIILDARYRFATAGSSENDNSETARFYNLVDRIAEMTGAAIILIHHSTKGGQADKRTTDVGAGAGAQSRAADCHLILREHEEDGVVVLDAAVRSFAPVEPMALRWEFPLWIPDASADPGRLKRQPTRQEQQQADRDREGMAAIVQALRKGPATKGELRRLTGISKDRMDRLVDLLCFDQQIDYDETTVKGNQCKKFRLAE